MDSETTLGERYTALVAKRPDLKVECLEWWPDDGPQDDPAYVRTPMWVMNGNGPFVYAESLIGWKLLSMLPETVALRNVITPIGWTCGNVCSMGRFYGPTPLEALLVFWEAQ